MLKIFGDCAVDCQILAVSRLKNQAGENKSTMFVSTSNGAEVVLDISFESASAILCKAEQEQNNQQEQNVEK